MTNIESIYNRLKEVLKRKKEFRIRKVHSGMYKLFESINMLSYLPIVAGIIYRSPSKKIKLVGVTGTNGKTTTAFLIYQALNHLNIKTGFIGTIGAYIGGEKLDTRQTTPLNLELNSLLRKMVNQKCEVCVMEVSSIGLDEKRVDGLQFSGAVFTNLTHDHLDFHGNMDSYANSKAKLFKMLPETAFVIINKDDPYYEKMIADTKAEIISFSQYEASESLVYFQVLSSGVKGMTLNFDGFECQTELIGDFNAKNLVAAYSVIKMLGLSKEKAVKAISKVKPPPGRLERALISSADQEKLPTVFVDYAHTPDALENLLLNINKIKSSQERIFCLFGCGGDRDKDKRAKMGAIANKYCQSVYLTSDNSRTEKTNIIFADILSGVTNVNAKWVQISDRAEAIKQAIIDANKNTIVLIVGKGHENYQEVNGRKYYFNDVEEAGKGLREFFL